MGGCRTGGNDINNFPFCIRLCTPSQMCASTRPSTWTFIYFLWQFYWQWKWYTHLHSTSWAHPACILAVASLQHTVCCAHPLIWKATPCSAFIMCSRCKAASRKHKRGRNKLSLFSSKHSRSCRLLLLWHTNRLSLVTSSLGVLTPHLKKNEG